MHKRRYSYFTSFKKIYPDFVVILNVQVGINCHDKMEKAMATHSCTLAWKILARDRGAWWAAVHGVARSRTRLSNFTFPFHFHALEKEMATHSRVLAWTIQGLGEPGGLPSMGSHRVGHDWSDLAAAAAMMKTGILWVISLNISLFHFSLVSLKLLSVGWFIFGADFLILILFITILFLTRELHNFFFNVFLSLFLLTSSLIPSLFFSLPLLLSLHLQIFNFFFFLILFYF